MPVAPQRRRVLDRQFPLGDFPGVTILGAVPPPFEHAPLSRSSRALALSHLLNCARADTELAWFGGALSAAALHFGGEGTDGTRKDTPPRWYYLSRRCVGPRE
mmetsp:Transcript_7295/g.19010  ORF Transcript_7295/g.19010 Transcript_7295/m.19010 type:complete len:103 (+) Transcript_7295:26-334(+)